MQLENMRGSERMSATIGEHASTAKTFVVTEIIFVSKCSNLFGLGGRGAFDARANFD